MGEVIEIEEAVQEPWPLAEEIIKKAANAQWPTLHETNGRLGLRYTTDAMQKTYFENYAYLVNFTVGGEGSDRVLYASCKVQGCTKKPSKTNVAKFTATSMDFTNMFTHLKTSHWDFLTPSDQSKHKRPLQAAISTASSMDIVPMPDENDQLTYQAHLIIGTGFPLSFVDSLPWIEFCKQHGLRHFSRKTITARIKSLQDKLIGEPMKEFMKYLNTLVPLVVNGVRLSFLRKKYVGNDGYTDRRGRALESFVFATGRSSSSSSLSKRQLRPHILHAALRHYQIDTRKGETYRAEIHGQFIADVLITLGCQPEQVLVMVLDTTYGQPKMTESKALSRGGLANLELDIRNKNLPTRTGVGYGPCGQHVGSLIGQDLEKVSMFVEAQTAEHELTVFLRGSDPRMIQLRQMLAELKMPILMPLMYPATRFLYALTC